MSAWVRTPAVAQGFLESQFRRTREKDNGIPNGYWFRFNDLRREEFSRTVHETVGLGYTLST